MPEITMDEARIIEHTGPDEQDIEHIIQLPGSLLKPGHAHYDANLHKGELSCRFCEAGVHYKKGHDTRCGDNLYGQSPHFATNPNQAHSSSCTWKFRQASHASSKVDDTRGYKIHLNTDGVVPAFNRAGHQFYARGEDHKIIVLKQDLETRRPRHVAEISQLVDLMQEGNFERLNDSVVIHHGHLLDWQEYMVRYDHSLERGQRRFARLVNRLQFNGPQPCMMEFNVGAGVTVRNPRDVPPVKSKDVYIGKAANDQPQIVHPRIYLRNRHDPGIANGFNVAGTYLVMGQAELKSYTHDGALHHNVSIKVGSPSQFSRISLQDITQTGRQKEASRLSANPA